MNFAHCLAVRELAKENAKSIRQLANAFVEGQITEEELKSDVEFHSLVFLKKVLKLKHNGNRKGA